MKLSRLKKLIKEEIKKLHEQELDPNQDCSEETGLFAGASDLQIWKVCSMCENPAIDQVEDPNEWGFYIPANECFCCKDYDWEDYIDNDGKDEIGSDAINAQVHWWGTSCSEQQMAIAWSAWPTLGGDLYDPEDGPENPINQDLSACPAMPDTNPYCKLATEAFWLIAGSPEVGQIVYISNGANNNMCLEYLGTTDDFSTTPNGFMALGWANGMNYNSMYNSDSSIFNTTCDSIECGGKGIDNEEDIIDCTGMDVAFDGCEEDNSPLQCGGFSNWEDFCFRCNLEKEATMVWAQSVGSIADCDCCSEEQPDPEGIALPDTNKAPLKDKSKKDPQIDRMQKLAKIKK